MPVFSALNQASFTRPGTASIFTPKAGRPKSWITSAPVTSTCTVLFTGTTIGVSAASR